MPNQLPPTPSESTPPAPKWWAASRTVWGAVIAALAAVLPALGPLLGITIPPELVQQLGDQVVQLVQGVVGLVGTILTIYGRMRATAPLKRRPVSLSLILKL
jgi:hypothetical protein